MKTSDTPMAIAVSWASFEDDPWVRGTDGEYIIRDGEKIPGPALEFLFDKSSPMHERTGKFYILCRVPQEESAPIVRKNCPREHHVAEELQHAVNEHHENNGRVTAEIVEWRTTASHSDFEAILHFLTNEFDRLQTGHRDADFMLNISTGSAVAHAAFQYVVNDWFARQKVRTFQVVPRDARRSDRDAIREIPIIGSPGVSPALVSNRSGLSDLDQWEIETAASQAFRDVANLIDQYAWHPYPVLIIGPRGSGKTSVAQKLRKRYIEEQCRAKSIKPGDKPGKEPREKHREMHRLNCAEFEGNPEMMRSSLFGHKKGSFTNATADKKGLLEIANGDCVFLDEIHLMSRGVQGTLHVALDDEGHFYPVGATAPVRSSFRLITATNRTIPELKRVLAPDFFDRISTFRIELPGLRDCAADMGGVWRSVVRKACIRTISHTKGGTDVPSDDPLVSEL
ncbi:MAG: sigma-54 factor interaction domain-containing protein, partial [Polyangiaceae bacterium]|nr:sigma-54 factor interaction domain-containing protein [Polyangiaceae bacterium]